MLSWTVNKTSTKSPVHALDRALKEATDSAKDYPHTDIILTDIKKLAKGWRAELNVITAPKRSHAPEPHLDMGSVLAHEQDEKDKQHEKEKLELHKHQLDDFYHNWLVNEIGIEYTFGQEADSVLILISELAFEQEVYAAVPPYAFTAIHFVPQGSLWKLAQSRQPDVELYEAAHMTAPEAKPNTESELSGSKPKPRPGRHSVLSPELTEE